MKKIFILILIICFCKTSFSQYPVQQNLGGNTTLISLGNANGGAIKGNLINGLYTDTTAANATQIDFYAGAQIFTTSDTTFWIRNNTATRWIQLGGGSGSVNIYNSDGTLTGNRNLYINNNEFSFYAGGVASGKVLFFSPERNYIGSPNSTRQLLFYPDSVLFVNTDVSSSSSDSVLVRTSTGRLKTRAQSALSYWALTGNSGTTAGTNFLGTTDSVDLVFKTKALERFRWNARGALALGTGTDYGVSGQVLSTIGATGSPVWLTPSTVATSVPLSGITATTETNSINNANYTQTWNWPTLTSGALLINAASTAMTNSSYVFGVVTSGANASSNRETRAGEFQNTHTGTNSTNSALKLGASGGTINRAIWASAGDIIVEGGNVGIGTSTPDSLLHNAGSFHQVGNARFDGLSDFADTTNFKPVVINTTGTAGVTNRLYKATYWPGGGGGGLTKGTTTIANSATRRVLYDSAGILSNNDLFQYNASGELQIGSGTDLGTYNLQVTGKTIIKASGGNPIEFYDNNLGAVGMSLLYGQNSGGGQYDLAFYTSAGNVPFYIEQNTGNVFINPSLGNSPSAKLHVRHTTEQLRLDYDASNYYSTTVGSGGGVTFDAVGSGARFTYSDGITLPAGTTAASTAPLKLTTGTSLTTAEAGALEYTTPQLFFTNGAAVRQEIPQIQQSRVSTQFDKTSDVTLANITGLTASVAAGKTYRFEAKLYTTSNVGGGVKVAIAGTATATAIVYEGLTIDAGLTTQSRSAALAGAVGAVTAVTAAYIEITGTITVNAAGTLTVQFAQNASNGTASSVLVGSTFVITEML